MKRSLVFSLVALALVGCSAAPSSVKTLETKAPVYALEVGLQGKQEVAPFAKPAAIVTDSYLATLAQVKEMSKLGAAIDQVQTLTAEDAPDRAVAAKPESSQEKADGEAYKWASDSRQLYIGWGFKWVSLFGTSRHAYYSPSRNRVLLIDYNWLGFKKHASEVDSPVYRLAAAILSTPHDDYLYNCKQCFNMAKDAGYENRAQNCRAFMVQLPILGPHWIFLDSTDRPQVIVNARSGSLTTTGPVIEILRFLFTTTL